MTTSKVTAVFTLQLDRAVFELSEFDARMLYASLGRFFGAAHCAECNKKAEQPATPDPQLKLPL